MALHYYIIDTETTGLKSGFHEIVQLSVIRCQDDFQKTMNICAKYPERADKQALAITKKSIYDIQQGIDRNLAVEQLNTFFADDQKTSEHRCIVAHNAPFDRRFLHALYESCGQIFPADLWMCTKEFSRKLAKRMGVIKPKLTLDASLERAGIEKRAGAHNAVVDSLNTLDLWKKLMSENLGHVSIIKRVPHEF